MNRSDLCPICGSFVRLRGGFTTDGRLVGTCGDSFTVKQWAMTDAEQQIEHDARALFVEDAPRYATWVNAHETLKEEYRRIARKESAQ